MPNYPDHVLTGQDYRQLAHRLRQLAQETRRPFARRELLRLSGIYDRRAEHLDSRADYFGPPPTGNPGSRCGLAGLGKR
jgi:hypothetical protein